VVGKDKRGGPSLRSVRQPIRVFPSDSEASLTSFRTASRDVIPRRVSAEGPLASLGATKKEARGNKEVGSGRQPIPVLPRHASAEGPLACARDGVPKESPLGLRLGATTGGLHKNIFNKASAMLWGCFKNCFPHGSSNARKRSLLFLSIGKKEMSPFARHDNDGVEQPRFAKQNKVRAITSIPQARNPSFSLWLTR